MGSCTYLQFLFATFRVPKIPFFHLTSNVQQSSRFLPLNGSSGLLCNGLGLVESHLHLNLHLRAKLRMTQHPAPSPRAAVAGAKPRSDSPKLPKLGNRERQLQTL